MTKKRANENNIMINEEQIGKKKHLSELNLVILFSEVELVFSFQSLF